MLIRKTPRTGATTRESLVQPAAPPSPVAIPEISPALAQIVNEFKNSNFFRQHISRIRASLDPAQQIASVADYMVAYTRLKGKPFTFDKFLFQRMILDHPAAKKVIRKPSQKGVSELMLREAICFCLLHAGENAMMVMPTAVGASKQSATRLAPIIDESPHIAENIHKQTDSATVKRFLNGSFLFFQGASGVKQTISIPVSWLGLDELDFADEEITSSFTSRLAASDFKIERAFSTPTSSGVGISAQFEASKRHWPVHKCPHCGHKWIIDYYKDVRLPGYTRELATISPQTKDVLSRLDLNRAYVECPNKRCGRKLLPKDLQDWEYVCENLDQNYDAAGFQVTPFQVPLVCPPSALILDATKYNSPIKFCTDALGLPSEDATTGLSEAEIEALFTENDHDSNTPAYQIAGVDLGGTCAALTANVTGSGHIRIQHAELIPLTKMRRRVPELFAAQRVIASVFDSQPYIDLIMQLQASIPSLWAAQFVETKTLELFQIREKQEDETKASFGLRQINVRKHQGLDLVMNMVRAGKISFAPTTSNQQLKQTIIQHLTDMKRGAKKMFGEGGQEEFVWRKTAKGIDHFHHAMLYLVIASYVRGISSPAPRLTSVCSKFKLKNTV